VRRRHGPNGTALLAVAVAMSFDASGARILLGIHLGYLTQADASGREISAEEIKELRSPSAISSGVTRLKR
jgi:hypothetical protein